MSITPPSYFAEPPPLAADERFPPLFASRWRRSSAFFLDAVLIGIVAQILCVPFFEELVSLGVWGRLMGFLISLAYFAYFESEKGHGQTPGKRLLTIKLVNQLGQTLPLPKATLRAFIFSVPFFLSGLPLSIAKTPDFVATAIPLLVGLLSGTIYYLLLFNNSTRQGLHDFIVGSYVVGDSEAGMIEVEPIWRRHWMILAGIASVSVIVLPIAAHKVEGVGPFPRLLQDVMRLEAIPGVERAGVQDLHMVGVQEGSTRRMAVVTLHWRGGANHEETVADQAALVLLRADPQMAHLDLVRVIVIRGFDIGIASKWKSQVFEHSPELWGG